VSGDLAVYLEAEVREVAPGGVGVKAALGIPRATSNACMTENQVWLTRTEWV
jgi:hypothetical protein